MKIDNLIVEAKERTRKKLTPNEQKVFDVIKRYSLTYAPVSDTSIGLAILRDKEGIPVKRILNDPNFTTHVQERIVRTPLISTTRTILKNIINAIPLSVEEAKQKIEHLRKTSKKLPTKPLKLKEATEDFDELIKLGRLGSAEDIYIAGVDWKQFNYEKGLDTLVKIGDTEAIYNAGVDWKQFNYEKGLDALIKIGGGSEEYVHYAGLNWEQFDYKKGLSFLKGKSKYFYELALKKWPKGVKASKAEIERLEKTSKKLPTKPLKLKEATEDFGALIKSSDGYDIYLAGMDWKQFDYEKGSDALIKAGKAQYIYYAGKHWKQFNYKKGLDALIKIGNTGYIYDAGRDWKQFDYEKGLSFLKKNSNRFYELALKYWPKGVKETKAEIERLEKTSKKLPTKPLKLKEATKFLNPDEKKVLEALKKSVGQFFSVEGLVNELIPLMDEGIDVKSIMRKPSEVSTLFMRYLSRQGFELKSFHILINQIIESLPRGAKESKAEIERLERTSKKLPTKPLKLKEAVEDFNKLIKGGDAYDIYHAGKYWKQFDYERGLDALIKIGSTEGVYVAGKSWKQFDHEKGLKFLKKRSKKFYKRALKYWPKGAKESKAEIERLEKTSKELPTKPLKLKEETSKEKRETAIICIAWTGLRIMGTVTAYDSTPPAYKLFDEIERGNFTYEEIKEALQSEKAAEQIVKITRETKGEKVDSRRVKKYLLDRILLKLRELLPKGVKETKAEIERLEKYSKKLPTKPLKLKEATEDFDKLIKTGDALNIYYAGRYRKQFDYDRGFDALIKIGDTEAIYFAGKYWKQFDHEKALKFLRNNSNKYYRFALKSWPKGVKRSKAKIKRLEKYSKKLPTKKLKLKEATEDFDALIKTGYAEAIYNAGVDWKQFNYGKGLDALIKTGNAGYTYLAGLSWKQFDYEKGLKFLKNRSESWYKTALRNWPKGIKETKAEIERLKRTSKKLPTKKLRLKEWLTTIRAYEER